MKKIFVLLAILIISGCATVSRDEIKKIKSISFEKNDIEVTEELYYESTGQALAGAIFGPLGALAAEGEAKGPREILKNIVQSEEISVSDMLLTSVKEKIEDKKLFILKENQADARIKIKVFRYGLTTYAPFSSKIIPDMVAIISIVTNENVIIFKKRYRNAWADPDPSIPKLWKEYIENPEYIREGFQDVVRQIVEKFMADLE